MLAWMLSATLLTVCGCKKEATPLPPPPGVVVLDIGATLTPGTSALFGLGRNMQLDKAQAKFGPLFKGGTILQTTVSEERKAENRKMLEGA